MSGDEEGQSVSLRRPLVLVTHAEIGQPAIDLLETKCDVIKIESNPPERSEILKKCVGVTGILWACNEKLDAEILDAAGPSLQSISTLLGLDNVDIDAVKIREIPVGHASDVASDAVADVAVGLLLASIRRFQEARKCIDNDKWGPNHVKWMLGSQISGSIVAFYGFGKIGKAIFKRLAGFNVGRFTYTQQIDCPFADELPVARVTFCELLKESDIIIVVSGQNKRKKFDESAFFVMKCNCVFINVGNSILVDQNALYKALKLKKIFAAGLDTMTPEPIESYNPLLQLQNCVLTPHLGSSTVRAQEDAEIIAAHNILRGLANERMFQSAYEI